MSTQTLFMVKCKMKHFLDHLILILNPLTIMKSHYPLLSSNTGYSALNHPHSVLHSGEKDKVNKVHCGFSKKANVTHNYTNFKPMIIACNHLVIKMTNIVK